MTQETHENMTSLRCLGLNACCCYGADTIAKQCIIDPPRRWQLGPRRSPGTNTLRSRKRGTHGEEGNTPSIHEHGEEADFEHRPEGRADRRGRPEAVRDRPAHVLSLARPRARTEGPRGPGGRGTHPSGGGRGENGGPCGRQSRCHTGGSAFRRAGGHSQWDPRGSDELSQRDPRPARARTAEGLGSRPRPSPGNGTQESRGREDGRPSTRTSREEEVRQPTGITEANDDGPGEGENAGPVSLVPIADEAQGPAIRTTRATASLAPASVVARTR